MDQTPPTPTTTSNGSDFKITNTKKYPKKIIFIISLVVLVLIGLYFYSQNSKPLTQSEPWNTYPKFAPTVQLATVGSEPIYGSDLNFVLYTNYPNNKMTDQQAKDVALKTVATTSAILQAAKAQQITVVPEQIFNGADYNAKIKLTNQIREIISSKSTKYSASAISIWYYNSTPPKIPESQARQTARTKIAKLLNDLRSSKITMEQAGNQIRNDKSLAQLDSNYKGNAYINFNNWTMDDPPFSFSVMNRTILGMTPKQYSDIIEIEISTNMIEKLFTIVYLDNVSLGQFPSVTDWVKSASQQYPLQLIQTQ